MRKLPIYWIPPIVCVLAIFILSSQTRSEQDLKPWLASHLSRQLLYNIKLDDLKRAVSARGETAASVLEFYIRKAAHFLIYWVLGFSLIFAFSRKWKSHLIWGSLLSFMIAFVYALSDEFHQRFVRSRHAQFSDVLLDAVGAGFGIACFFIARKISQKLRERHAR